VIESGQAGVVRREFFMGLGVPEVILILIVFMLLFGAKRLPDLASGLGKGIRNFKEATREGMDDADKTK
jgi:sec-independent protein translocase protein TatA